MQRRLTMKVLVGSVAFIVSIFLLALSVMTARWIMVAGSHAGLTAMSRLIKHGSTRIDDFKHYPARYLQASSTPYRFTENGGPSRVPQTIELKGFKPIEMEDLLQNNDTIAFMVVKDDALIFERYYQEHTAASFSQFFSVTKSIISVLVGAAIDDGYIRSVDQPVTDFMPELGEQGFAKVTLKHLLTMTSGIDYTENDNPFGLHAILNYTPDLKKMILDFRLHGEAGQAFKYKSCDTALIGLILARTLSPMSITAYFQKRIWSPLGMEYGGMWTMDGNDGQFLYVNPAKRLIIVRLGWSKGDLGASQWIALFKVLSREIN